MMKSQGEMIRMLGAGKSVAPVAQNFFYASPKLTIRLIPPGRDEELPEDSNQHSTDHIARDYPL